MNDLRERVPGHALVDELLRQWDVGTIHVDSATNKVVIDDEAVSWYRGVVGERRVAELLSQLSSEWTVLHSVPVGRGSSDIDHVVIGPAGIFTLNSKYSPGKRVWSSGDRLRVDGYSQKYVRNSMGEAERASDLLSRAVGMTVPVTGLIVFVNPGEVKRGESANAHDTSATKVIADHELLATLASRRIFSDEQVTRIVDRAVLPHTWHETPVTSTIGRHISREFEALEAAVGPQLAAAVKRPIKAPSPSRSRKTANRPPSRRPSNKRKPKQSPLEKLMVGLVGPAAALAVAWGILNYMTSR